MLPDTSTPIAPSCRPEFAWVKDRYLHFSQKLSQYESCYRKLGLRYHSLTLELRQNVNSATRDTCSRQLLVVDGEDPPLIQDLNRLRLYKNDIKAVIKRTERAAAVQTSLAFGAVLRLIQLAEELFGEMDELLDDVHEALVALEFMVERMEDAKWRFALEQNLEASQDDQAEKDLLFRTWAERLPEVRYAIEQLGFDVTEAIAFHIETEEIDERCLGGEADEEQDIDGVVILDDMESTDDESYSSDPW